MVTQVKSGTIFDNVLVTDDKKCADELMESTFGKMKDEEKKQKEKSDEEERKKREEEDKKRKEEGWQPIVIASCAAQT